MIQTTYTPDYYNGTGLVSSYAFHFRILRKADLIVKVLTIATGAVVTLVLDSDYTIPDADVNTPSGGSVVLSSPLASGDRIFLIRDTARTQLVDLTEASPFPAETVEKEFDRLTMMIQELTYGLRQAAAFADTSLFIDISLPDPQNGDVLGWVNGILANVDPSQGLVIGDEVSITPSDSTYAVVFDDELANVAYQIIGLTANWPTTIEWNSKATTGFSVIFGTPAPADAKFVWRVRV